MNLPLTKRICAVLVFSVLAAFTGCTPPPGTGSANPVERYIKSGQEQARRNDFTGALAAFNKALALDFDNASVHYELAGLYDNDLNAPEKALYHYTRVLEINPDYRWADIIKDRLPGLRMRVSSGSIPMVPCPELEKEIVDLHRTLAEKNVELQHQVDQNQDLRRQLRVLQVQAPTTSQPAQRLTQTDPRQNRQRNPIPPADTETTSAPTPNPNTTRATRDESAENTSRFPYAPPKSIRYTVLRGDTLYSLGKRYGVGHQKILQANPGLVATDIKVG
jgi:tetratricopeptide (TPR) repeat protein